MLAGCAVAFAGCVVIGLATIQHGARSGPGLALCLVAVLAYSAAVVIQKPVLARVSPFQVTWLGCVAGTVACLPFAPALATEVAQADPDAVGWMIYLGAVPTALGFTTWAFALRRATAGRTASLNYLIPVVAVVLGWAVLGQTPPWLAVAGGALCLLSVYLARRRARPVERLHGSPTNGSREHDLPAVPHVVSWTAWLAHSRTQRGRGLLTVVITCALNFENSRIPKLRARSLNTSL